MTDGVITFVLPESVRSYKSQCSLYPDSLGLRSFLLLVEIREEERQLPEYDIQFT